MFRACRKATCSRISVRPFDKDKDQNRLIITPMNLSPCKIYDRIRIYSELRGNKTTKVDKTSW